MPATLTREQIEFAKARTLQCEICKKLFTQKSNLRRHIKQQHSPEHKIATISCQRCGTQVKETSLNAHMQTQKCLRAQIQSTFHMPLSSNSMTQVASASSIDVATTMQQLQQHHHAPASGCSRSPSPASPAFTPMHHSTTAAAGTAVSSFSSGDTYNATSTAAPMLTSATYTNSSSIASSYPSYSSDSMDVTMSGTGTSSNMQMQSDHASSGSPSIPHFVPPSTVPPMQQRRSSSSRSPSLPHFLPVSSMPVLSRESVASLASVTSAAAVAAASRKTDRKRSRSCSQNSVSSIASMASSRSMTDCEGDAEVDDDEEPETTNQPPQQKRAKSVRSASEDAIRAGPPKVHFVPWHVPVLVVVSQDQFNKSLSSSSSPNSTTASAIFASTSTALHSESNIQEHIRVATALANSKFGASCVGNAVGKSISRAAPVGRRTSDPVLAAQRSENFKSEFSASARNGDRSRSCGVKGSPGSPGAGAGAASSRGQIVSSPMFTAPSSTNLQRTLMSRHHTQNGGCSLLAAAQHHGQHQQQQHLQTTRAARARSVESDAQGHVLSPDCPEDLAAIRPPPPSPSLALRRRAPCQAGCTSTLAAAFSSSSPCSSPRTTRDAHSLLNLWRSAVSAQSRAQTSCASLDSVSLEQVTASTSAPMAPLVVRTDRPTDVLARIEEVTQMFARDNESRSAALLSGGDSGGRGGRMSHAHAQQASWSSRGRSCAITSNV